MTIPDTTEKIKQRISRYKSSLKKEKREYGYISDGSGKRYLLFCFYFLLGDLKKAKEYFEWYQSEFPDDSGEPMQLLCWAIILHHLQKEAQAKSKLAESMLSNLYIIPKVIGREIKKYNMWHSSNYCEPEYIEGIPLQIIRKLSVRDIAWITSLFDSFEFQRIRKRYVEIYHELQNEKGMDKRSALVDESYNLLNLLQ